MFHLIWYVIIGFVVGLIARAVMPGPDPMGFLGTTALGILGSLVGGVIGGLIWRPREGARFHPAGLLLSIIGAMLVLFIWQRIQ